MKKKKGNEKRENVLRVFSRRLYKSPRDLSNRILATFLLKIKCESNNHSTPAITLTYP